MSAAGYTQDLLQRIKSVAAEYYRATGKTLGVAGEVGEQEAARKLGLTLAEARAPGYDAIDTDGKKIQIKTRTLQPGKPAGRVPSINIKKDFDAVMLVLLNADLEPMFMYRADRDAVVAKLTAPGSKARNERNSMAVNQFMAIGRVVWTDTDTDATDAIDCTERRR
jgi:hypothetical protein